MFSNVLLKTSSPIHGTLFVRERFGRKELVTRGSDGEFSQSGPLVAQIWSSVLKESLASYKTPSVLIMGLGGGTLIDMVATYRPHAAIDVVEIDPDILTIARTCFDFDPSGATVYLDSAQDFVRLPRNGAYDLICVDLYCHSAVPAFTEGTPWLTEVLRISALKGRVIFNRLAFDTFRKPSEQFIQKLSDFFPHVSVVRRPSRLFASNMLIVCSR